MIAPILPVQCIRWGRVSGYLLQIKQAVGEPALRRCVGVPIVNLTTLRRTKLSKRLPSDSSFRVELTSCDSTTALLPSRFI